MTTSLAAHIHQRLIRGLNQDTPTPIYFRIFRILKEMILDGSLAYGERMPTEAQLVKAINISRITAKRSMDELANENLIERRRGKGSHIIFNSAAKPLQVPLVGMLKEDMEVAEDSIATVLDCKMICPPSAIISEMALKAKDTVLYLTRTREKKGIKFGYFLSWTHNLELPDNLTPLETETRFGYFQRLGLQVTHVTQSLEVVSADHEVSAALEIEIGSPVLKLIRRSFNTVDGAEVMCDYLTAMYNPQHYQYKMTLKLGHEI